jgi:hypothetical protein
MNYCIGTLKQSVSVPCKFFWVLTLCGLVAASPYGITIHFYSHENFKSQKVMLLLFLFLHKRMCYYFNCKYVKKKKNGKLTEVSADLNNKK